MTIPEILYEDNHLLVVVKPPGVLSQEDQTRAPDMLTILKAWLKEKYKKPGNVYLGLLQRLDRPVSGVMVFAKTSKAASRMSEQIRKGLLKKKYHAVVWGIPEKKEDKIQSWLVKDEEKNKVTVFSENKNVPANAKEAILYYRVIEEAVSFMDQQITLLDVDLKTGRSHQIRAQLSANDMPLVGDRKYGPNSDLYKGEICLESYMLSFEHPVTKEQMQFQTSKRYDSPWNLFIEHIGINKHIQNSL